MLRCVGCNRSIPLDLRGTTTFSYTCPCGSHIFLNEDTEKIAVPISLVQALIWDTNPPHLDYLVGLSTYTSTSKESLIAALKEIGAIWMEDCEACQENGNLEDAHNREKHLAILEIQDILRRYR